VTFETVTYEKRHGVAEITLNRPAYLNAINLLMQEELSQIWRDFDEDDTLRVAIVTGAGEKAFSSGADVKEWAGGSGPGSTKTLDHMGKEALTKYTPLRLPTWKPVIAAVNGICAGAGLHLVHDSDIILASEHATFFDTHLAVGQVAAGEPIGLSRRMPLGVVLGMTLLGKHYRLSAQRAFELGLVLEVVQDGSLMDRARELAEIVLEQAPMATRISKKAIYASLDLGLSDAYELGSYMMQSAWGSDEGIEGPRAFAEKRAPNWFPRDQT
jgi:enoyl-CoA hydratase/carnithine racemase